MKKHSFLCAIVAGSVVLLGAAGCTRDYQEAEVIDDALLQEVVNTNNGLNNVVIEMLPMLQNGFVSEPSDVDTEDIPEYVKPYIMDFGDYDAFVSWNVRTELVKLTADNNLDQEQKLAVARCLGSQLYYKNLFQNALATVPSKNSGTKAGEDPLSGKDLLTDSFFSGLYVTDNLGRRTGLNTRGTNDPNIHYYIYDASDSTAHPFDFGAAEADTVELTDEFKLIEDIYSSCKRDCWLDLGFAVSVTAIFACAITLVPEGLAAGGTASEWLTALTTPVATFKGLSSIQVVAILDVAEEVIKDSYSLGKCLDKCKSNYYMYMDYLYGAPWMPMG